MKVHLTNMDVLITNIVKHLNNDKNQLNIFKAEDPIK
jgi:hypothetical protein